MKNKYLIAVALILLTLVSCSPGEENTKNNNQSSAANSSIRIAGTNVSKLLNSQVCMVNNKFMNKDQIAVPVDNKTYYGCCEGCVAKLKNDAASRYALDPLTGERVDKALAVIIVKPGTKVDVLYFNSEINVKKYFGKLDKN